MRLAVFAVSAACLAPASGFAQEAAGWSTEGAIGAVTDYRYRGVSLSERDPAVQGELTVSAPSGLYAYGWASSIRYGDDVELMGALGWSGEASGLSLDVGGGVYAYPGLADSSLWEFYGSASRQVGVATLTGGAAYYPEQDNLGGEDNLYLHAGLSAPLGVGDLTGDLTIGWEDGAFGDNKTDWSASVTAPLGPFALRVAYVGTNVENVYEAEDAALAELRYKFAF